MVLPDDYADPPPKIWLRWLLGISAVVLLVGGWLFYLSEVWHPAFPLTPEQRDEQAVFTVYESLVMFVMTNGHWPYDEKDMREHVKYAGGRYAGAYYQWPGDASRLLKQVHVDFNVPLIKIVEADPNKFPYVYSKLKGPSEVWEKFASRLIGAANARVQGEMIEKEVMPHPTPKADQTKSGEEKPAGDKAKEPKSNPEAKK